jgi:hypothetical protein
MMRAKKITIEGLEFTIAPMNLDQTEQYLAPIEELADDPTKLRQIRGKNYEVVLAGLNNAIPDVVSTDDIVHDYRPWDLARLRKELDMVLYNGLLTSILQYSGLQPVPVEKVVPISVSPSTTPGESGAESTASPAASA